MKKSLSLIVIALLMGVGLFAQHREGMGAAEHEKRMAEYKARRVAFLTHEANLSPEEAAKFFPLYEEMMEKKMQMLMTLKKSNRELLTLKGKRDEVFQNALNELFDTEVEVTTIERSYYERLRGALSAEKLFRLKMAEDRFARSLMRNK